MPVDYVIDIEEGIEAAVDSTLVDVSRVEVDGDAVRFLGRKRRLLLAVDARSLIAASQVEAASNDGSEPTVVRFRNRDPLLLYGVDEVRSTTTMFDGAAFLVLGDDDRRPLAVVRANEVASVCWGQPAVERSLRAIAACTHADGRLVVLATDSSVDDGAPNVFCRTRELDGTWGSWDSMGDVRATDITAALDEYGRMVIVACDARQGGPFNITYATQPRPNEPLDSLAWEPMRGYLTSVSLAGAPNGRLQLIGCNTNQPRTGTNVHWCDSTTWASWRSAPHWLSTVDAVFQPDGTRMLVSLTFGVGDDSSRVTAHASTETMPLGWNWCRHTYAVRRPDGRIQIGGLSRWGDALDEAIQSDANAESGVWHNLNSRSTSMSGIAATVSLQGDLHVVGISDNPLSRGELLVRTEQPSGEPWRPWRPVPAG